MVNFAELDKVCKEINKKFADEKKFSVVYNGAPTMAERGTIRIGIPSFDFMTYDTFPRGQFVEICGYESSGKTTLTYIIVAAYIREELKKPEEERKAIIFADLEHTADRTWAKKCGYDMAENAAIPTKYFAPTNMNAEQILSTIVKFTATGQVGLVVIDSLNKLVPKQVFDEELDKKEMGGIAKVLSDFTNRMQGMMDVYKCTVIGIQQGRDNISGYGNPFTTSGGRGWKAACALRIMVKKGEPIDQYNNKLKSTAEYPAGYIMEIGLLKSKVAKTDRKLGKVYFNYTTGPDIVLDTVEIASYFGLVDNSTQGWYKLLDPDTGMILKNEDGSEVKIHGEANVKPYLESHPDIWRRLYDECYKKLSAQDDPNVVAFERMLNMDMDKLKEYFGVDDSEFE